MLVHEGALTSDLLLMIIGINATDVVKGRAVVVHRPPPSEAELRRAQSRSGSLDRRDDRKPGKTSFTGY